jgi:serine/threonine-protein kinase RsbW
MPSLNGNRARPDQDEVTVRVPALRRYVGSVRALATSVAAQSGLTVDEIEDVQMAVDEACALLLQHVSRSRVWLDLRLRVSDGVFAADVAIATPAAIELDRSSLAWTVLSALTDELELSADGPALRITFTKNRAPGSSVQDRPDQRDAAQ